MGVFKIKKLFVILSFLLLCGCSANYTIEIKDNKVIENSNLLIDKKSIENKSGALGSISDEIEYVYNNLHDIENGQEEEKTRSFNLEKIDNENLLGLKFNNEYTLDNFTKSPIIRQCYESVSILSNDLYFNINTSSVFKCYDYYKYLDEVKIILKTDYNVRTNFDEKKDNTYYWYINKDNYKNKSINISVLKNNAIIEDNEKIIIGDNYINMFLYILVIIIIIIGLVILLKVKKSNK